MNFGISRYRFDVFFSGGLTYHRRFEIEENGPRHVFPAARFAEEGLETFVAATTSLRWQHTVRLYTVLQAIKLPAGVAHLHAALANVDRKYLALFISIN